jgi:hypothetical protein
MEKNDREWRECREDGVMGFYNANGKEWVPMGRMLGGWLF